MLKSTLILFALMGTISSQFHEFEDPEIDHTFSFEYLSPQGVITGCSGRKSDSGEVTKKVYYIIDASGNKKYVTRNKPVSIVFPSPNGFPGLISKVERVSMHELCFPSQCKVDGTCLPAQGALGLSSSSLSWNSQKNPSWTWPSPNSNSNDLYHFNIHGHGQGEGGLSTSSGYMVGNTGGTVQIHKDKEEPSGGGSGAGWSPPTNPPSTGWPSTTSGWPSTTTKPSGWPSTTASGWPSTTAGWPSTTPGWPSTTDAPSSTGGWPSTTPGWPSTTAAPSSTGGWPSTTPGWPSTTAAPSTTGGWPSTTPGWPSTTPGWPSTTAAPSTTGGWPSTTPGGGWKEPTPSSTTPGWGQGSGWGPCDGTTTTTTSTTTPIPCTPTTTTTTTTTTPKPPGSKTEETCNCDNCPSSKLLERLVLVGFENYIKRSPEWTKALLNAEQGSHESLFSTSTFQFPDPAFPEDDFDNADLSEEGRRFMGESHYAKMPGAIRGEVPVIYYPSCKKDAYYQPAIVNYCTQGSSWDRERDDKDDKDKVETE